MLIVIDINNNISRHVKNTNSIFTFCDITVFYNKFCKYIIIDFYFQLKYYLLIFITSKLLIVIS